MTCHSKACAILFTHGQPFIHDETGCVLPIGHVGPHEFTDQTGKGWLWETDFECRCHHCMQCEGDYCTIYWPKPR